MTTKTKELLDTVDAAHDWAHGQTYGGSGDIYSSVDTCRICGLERHWNSGSRQNNIPASTTFKMHDGRDITLREAEKLEC